MSHDHVLLTVKDVSSILNISTTTIWRHVQSGSFPKPLKIGRLTRWRRSDIDQLIETAPQ